MQDFRFTLFNNITLLVLALTVYVAIWRFRGNLLSNWPLVYYAIVIAYTVAFTGGLHPAWVAAGSVSAVFLRVTMFPTFARVAELAALVYIAWRSIGLILLW